jgi:septal ring-binding cell division protein DamX
VKRINLTILLILISSFALAQEYNIIPLLKQLEQGEIISVKKEVQRLLIRNAGDPSLLFVDALVTENGENAVKKFLNLTEKFPQSKYADAAVFRLYSYYYAIGSYQTASQYFERLKLEYPNSPYIKSATQNVSLLVDEEESAVESEISVKENTPVIRNSNDYKFTIQTGAFSVASNAESLKRDLEKNDYFVQIKEKNVGGTTFYIVLSGRYSTEDEARANLNKIFEKFKISGRIVPFEN